MLGSRDARLSHTAINYLRCTTYTDLAFFLGGWGRGRYRKGKTSITGSLWWEVHEECMIVASEAVLPLGITAVITTGGSHDSGHAKWGESTIHIVS